MGFDYFLFGLAVHSNAPLPGVSPRIASASGADPNPPVVFLHLGVARPADLPASVAGETLYYESAYLDLAGAPALRIWRAADDSYLRLAYSDGTQFWVDRERTNLWAAWPEALSLENSLAYLLGPVFGLLLRLRGITALHASAVAIADRAVLFVGAEGAGKSTTAAAFAKLGYAILSDDIVAVSTVSAEPQASSSSEGAVRSNPRPTFLAFPAYPHLSLWADSAQALYGSESHLPRLAQDWDKRKLALGGTGGRFESRALPLAAIYLFRERSAENAPRIEPAPRKDALLSLVANTYANNLLDAAMRAEEFVVLDRLVANVPVRWLTPHSASAGIAKLCALIDGDVQALRIA